MLPPESMWILTDELPKRLKAIQSGEEEISTLYYEINLKNKNGSNVPTGIVARLVHDPEGNPAYLHGISRNMTEFLKMKQLLKQSEEKYRIIADYSSDWECWMDHDRTFLYMSPSSEKITGYPASDFMNDPSLMEKIVHPDDLDTFRKHVSSHGKENSTAFSNLVFRIITKDKRTIWIEHKCRPVCLSDGSYGGQRCSNRDITARMEAEERLKMNERMIRAILEATNDSVLMIDRDWKVLTANSLTARRLGTDIATLEERNVFDFLPFDISEKRKAKIRQVFESGKPVKYEDEGCERTFINNYYPVIDKDGVTKYVAIFARDVTEEKSPSGRP